VVFLAQVRHMIKKTKEENRIPSLKILRPKAEHNTGDNLQNFHAALSKACFTCVLMRRGPVLVQENGILFQGPKFSIMAMY